MRSRPARSVTSMRPSGRNARPHGCSSRSTSLTTRRACSSVVMVWAPAGAEIGARAVAHIAAQAAAKNLMDTSLGGNRPNREFQGLQIAECVGRGGAYPGNRPWIDAQSVCALHVADAFDDGAVLMA